MQEYAKFFYVYLQVQLYNVKTFYKIYYRVEFLIIL